MPTLLIRLLGSPKIEIDGVPIALDRNKAIALLVYLAVTGRSHQRDTLATLLWPESDHSHARASLRRDLSVLNKALGGFALEIERDTVRLDRGKLWLDVAQFNSLVEQGRSISKGDKETICTICLEYFAEAVQLYTEDFLSGFTLPDCPEFDEWQFFQVESLRQTYLGTLERLVNGYTQLRTPDQALAYARRWVGKDPTHEPAHMALIRIYADMGQQAAALRQYQVCVDTLHDELGLKPSSELTALYKQIRTSRQATPVAEKLIPELHPLHMHNIPVHPTPFLGRDRERAEINQRLNDPNCHLLTLIGPGGIGKTRLAIRAAQDVAAQPDSTSKYSDGIYFVSLASTQTAYQLVTSIAAAVDFSFYAEVDPQNQLLGYLSERKMLLVLDNFEQLLVLVDHTNESIALPDMTAADVVAAFLAAPDVQVMITSREALNLQGEWVYPVGGMEISDSTHTDDVQRASAIQLFDQCARRVQPEFSLERETPHVLEICRFVEGMPLAIELAAAWLRVLSPQVVAQQLTHNVDLLYTSARNALDRHRSIRVVFNQSWAMLTTREQTVLRCLSVFRGGFTQIAAEQIAGVSLQELAALIEKSFLRITSTGRYRLHELLGQLAAEKLTAVPDEEKLTRKNHCLYYLSYIGQRREPLKGQMQKDALHELRQDIANIQQAWRFALDQRGVTGIDAALEALYDFYWMSSRFQEGADAFQVAADVLPFDEATNDRVRRQLVARLGTFYGVTGHYAKARTLLENSLDLSRRYNDRREIAFILDALGNVLHIQGYSTEAIPLFQESLALSRQDNNITEAATSTYHLGWIEVRLGKYEVAKSHFETCLSLNRSIGNQVSIAHALDSLGMTAFFLGEYTTGESYFLDSLRIFDDLADMYGKSRALAGLGLISWGLGDIRLLQARQHLLKSLQMTRNIGHRLETARRLTFLGSIMNSLSDFDAAERYLKESLEISREIGFTFGIPWATSGLGTTALGKGDTHLANRYFLQALSAAMDAKNMPIVLDTLVSIASSLVHDSRQHVDRAVDIRRAVDILTVVLAHPASWQIIKDRASVLLARLQDSASPTQNNNTSTPISILNVDILVGDILAQFSVS